jgi:hypothetical protein
MAVEQQEEEENFDLSLIASLEIDVVPHLGDLRLPDSQVVQLAKILSQGSKLYDAAQFELSLPSTPASASFGTPRMSSEFVKVDMDRYYRHGTTEPGAALPRERFSYWCFDLLFLICSNTTKGEVAVNIPFMKLIIQDSYQTKNAEGRDWLP